MISNRCNGNRPRIANVTCDPRASKRSPFVPSLLPTFNLVFFVSILPPALIQPRMHFVQMKPLLPLISSSFSSIAYALLYTCGCGPLSSSHAFSSIPYRRFLNHGGGRRVGDSPTLVRVTLAGHSRPHSFARRNFVRKCIAPPPPPPPAFAGGDGEGK